MMQSIGRGYLYGSVQITAYFILLSLHALPGSTRAWRSNRIYKSENCSGFVKTTTARQSSHLLIDLFLKNEK